MDSPARPAPPADQPAPRILMLSTEYPPEILGGLGTYVYELAVGMVARGYQVDVLTLAFHTAATEQSERLTVHRIQPSAAQQAQAAPAFDDLVLQFNQDVLAYARPLLADAARLPDLIHCNDWFLCEAATALSRQFGIPLVCTMHLLREPLQRWWGEPLEQLAAQQERALCSQATAIITVSESMRAILLDVHGLPASRVHVVYNGMAFQPLERARLAPALVTALRQRVAAPHERIVLFAGRISPQKGIAALFEAADLVVREQPQVRYVLVGNPPSRDQGLMLQEIQARYPALQGKVTVINHVAREQLFHLYQVADIVQVPSIYEPFGYVAVEALALGLPVVATAVGGLAEIIRHEQTGLLVPVLTTAGLPHRVDAGALAAAQLRLLGDAALAQSLAQAGQAFVPRTFTLERMIAGTEQVYLGARGAA